MSLIWFRRLNLADLIEDLPPDAHAAITSDHTNAPDEVIRGLTYTESNWEWIALHEHCKRDQIHPKQLRRMRPLDLEFLAGSPPETDQSSEAARLKSNKLQANVTRATRELERRYANRTALGGAAAGAALGIFATIVVNHL